MPKPGITIVFAVLSTTLLFAQPRTVVFDFQPVGVDSNTAHAASVLLKGRMAEAGGFTMVEAPAGTKCYALEEAVTASKSLGAEKAVIGELVALGPRLVLSYKLVNVNASAIEFSDRTTLASIEDLDVASERIARALREKRPFRGTVEAGKATEFEAREPFRSRTPFSSIMFTTGYTFPIEHRFPYDPGLMLFTIDASVTYETRDILTQAMMGLRRGKNNFQDIGFDLLMHKMFSTLDISPYIGGGIGIHRISMGADWGGPERSDDGVNLTVSGGVVLFRTYYFRILVGGRGSVLLTEDLGPSYSASFNFGLPSPSLGADGPINAPTPCILGCLGAFFITGVIIALTT